MSTTMNDPIARVAQRWVAYPQSMVLARDITKAAAAMVERRLKSPGDFLMYQYAEPEQRSTFVADVDRAVADRLREMAQRLDPGESADVVQSTFIYGHPWWDADEVDKWLESHSARIVDGGEAATAADRWIDVEHPERNNMLAGKPAWLLAVPQGVRARPAKSYPLKWIHVMDVFPPSGVHVVVRYSRNEFCTAWRWGNAWDSHDKNADLRNVTHWARVPLPEDD